MKITPYNIFNVYALKKKKPELCFFYFIFLWLVIMFIIFSFIKISERISLNGIVSCENKICSIETVVTTEHLSFLSSDLEIEIAQQIYSIKSLDYGQLFYLDSTSSIGQKINISLDNFIYEENKLLSFVLKREDRNLWEIIWKSLKGGDEH